jgi:ACR3 family arsenite transporter
LAGWLTRLGLWRGARVVWFDGKFLPATGLLAWGALLFTIVVMFSLQGEQVLAKPLDGRRIVAAPAIYFAIMFTAAFRLSVRAGAEFGAAGGGAGADRARGAYPALEAEAECGAMKIGNAR